VACERACEVGAFKAGGEGRQRTVIRATGNFRSVLFSYSAASGSLVGFATWAETAGTIEPEDLFVDPGYMRRGIAAALVNRVAGVLRARGVERLEVTANPHALGFYRAAGFTDCGVAETQFGTAPRMVLAIS
jgi:GNAT superfamily N-acetyltransferase